MSKTTHFPGRGPAHNTSRREHEPEVPDPITFARTRLDFHPDEKQAKVLASTANRGILNCTRQWGKSTVCAIKAVHRALSQPASLVMVVSPGERQSAEFVRKASSFLLRLGIRPRGDGDNAVSLLFPNRSRIVGLPGLEATVRGFSAVSLMLVDEAARVKDEMYQAVRPMLAVGGGDLWLLSTPNGRRGFFWNEWDHGPEPWTRISVPATACPRINPEFLANERRALGSAVYRREYLCEFLESDTQVFNPDLIRRALRHDIPPLFPQRRLNEA